jgi:predicted dinucleotide-binding enzyme
MEGSYWTPLKPERTSMNLHPLIRPCGLLLFLAAVIAPAALWADTIAVIGTGSVGGALGPEFAAQGHEIVYGSRDPGRDKVRELVERTGHGARAATPAEAAASSDIVLLAVPGMLVEEITLGLGDLAGKIVIDPTNPLVHRDDGMMDLGVETSNSEIIQAAAPEAYVVKAFNTLNWRTMVDPGTSGGPVSIPLAGDNVEAKATVAQLVEGLGLEPIDVGPLRHAGYIEGMLVLWINNRFVRGQPFDYYLRPQSSE